MASNESPPPTMRHESTSTIPRVDRPYLAALLLFQLLVILYAALSPHGQRLVIDEACYIEWGMLQQPVPGNWIGMKLLPVLLVREGIGLFGHGLGTFALLKVVFALFSFLYAGAIYAWQRAEGRSEPVAFLAAAAATTFPVVVYGTARLLSEMPSMAFLALGIFALEFSARRTAAMSGRRAAFALLSAVSFVAAYFCRTTSLSAAGAYFAYRVFAEMVEIIAGRRDGTRYLRDTIVLPVALLYALTIVVCVLALPLPVPPFETAAGHAALHQRELHANVVSFAASFGVVAPLLVFATIVLLVARAATRELMFRWLWLLLAAAPYLYLWARQSWVLPRHTSDLALPLAAVLGAVLSIRVQHIPPKRAALSLAVLVPLAAAWWFAIRVMNAWVQWYNHHHAETYRFLAWAAVMAIVAVALLLAWRLSTGAQSSHATRRRLAVSFAAGLVLLVAQNFVALPAVAVDCTFLRIPRVLSVMKNSGIDDSAVIGVAGPHYYATTWQFLFPDRSIRAMNTLGGEYFVLEPDPAEDTDFILIQPRYVIDYPEMLEQQLARNRTKSAAREIAAPHQWIVYETYAPDTAPSEP